MEMIVVGFLLYSRWGEKEKGLERVEELKNEGDRITRIRRVHSLPTPPLFQAQRNHIAYPS